MVICSKHNFMKKFFTLITANTILFLSAGAQRLATEDFDYEAGQLTDIGGGLNVSGGVWTDFSGTGNYLQVNDGNLGYPNYTTDPAIDSRHLNLDTSKSSSEDAYLTFTAQTANTIYSTFLLNLLTLDYLPLHTSDSAEYFAAFLSSTSTSSYYCRVYARQGSSPGTYNLGVSAQSYKSTAINWVATDLAINSTHLVTMGYQIIDGANNDVAKLWVDEAFSSSEPAAQASSVFLVGTESTDAGRFALRQSYSTAIIGATPKCEIDAIKISTEWGDATLPVTLKSFTASSQNGSIALNWVSVNEVNMKEYVVERSADARNFSAIGIVPAKNSGTENSYGYTDVKALNGAAYYRLKMTDKDGSYHYSVVIPASAKLLKQLAVLGGIVNSNLVVSHPVAVSGALLRIVSLNGNVVATQHVQSGMSQTIMDVSRLASGNYIAMFINGTEKQSVQFAKQ